MGDKKGHPFRGNQYATLYHGTTEANWRQIQERGLAPHGVTDPELLRRFETEGSAHVVWLNPKREVAERYAAQRVGGKPVVLEVRVPTRDKRLLERNVPESDPQNRRYRGVIPAAWIKKLGG